MTTLRIGTRGSQLALFQARLVAERITAAGGSSVLSVYDDVMHGWHLMAAFVPEARDAVNEVAEFVRAHFEAR